MFELSPFSHRTDSVLKARGNTGGMGSRVTLAGLNVLNTLVICCSYQIVRRAVSVMSTWASPYRSTPGSVFELWLHSDSGSPFLHLHCVSSLFLRRCMLASERNGMRTFRGSFIFGLQGFAGNPIDDIDYDLASGIVHDIRDDSAIGLRSAECVRL